MPYLSEVNPNLISFASFAMMYPILNNLYYNGSTAALIMFVIRNKRWIVLMVQLLEHIISRQKWEN